MTTPATSPTQTQQKGQPFKPVDPRPNFVAMEERLLAWWTENDIVERYLQRNDRAEKRFSFIDGPITANNKMGAHHAWGRTYKDVFQRYRTMQGYRQRYQNGFDCQGLWVEVEVEKELGMKSKRDIEAYGVAEFVQKCKERVWKFSDIQAEQSIRLGYWMDWDNSYYTMSDENNYTIWHFLKKCWENGWLYRGHDVMPWCPRCGTGLSEHEISEGYKDVTHTSVFVRFPLQGRQDEYLLVWTTTPWTLPANVAAAVHPDLTYVKVRQDKATYYLAKGTLGKVIKGEHEVLAELPGRDLIGLTYSGPFDDLPAAQGVAHRIIAWTEVSESDGTGIVHIAPGCGKEDFDLSKVEGDLAVLAPIDESGIYVADYGWLSGMSAAEVARPIFANLREKGLLFRTESYLHRYPHCWRCGTELVYRLVDEWYISMDSLRERIAAVARQIRWIPEFGLDRELDWLKNMHDWMISKKRYWGLALPIYPCVSCGTFEVIGSEDELHARAIEGWDQFAGHSPHRPWVDAVKIRCAGCGQPVERVADVGNVWLDAGIVPYSTLNYRHNRAYWDEWFPAEFITESFPGQFRNWFYSMLTMSTVLEDRPPFQTVLGFGLMRDEKGDEMHKSKGNAIWFDEAARMVGADSMRWIFMNHNPAANLNFGLKPPVAKAAENTTDEAVRQFMLPVWNIYSFFVLYANIDGFNPLAHSLPVAERSGLDRWILAELNELVADCTAALDDYDAARAARAMETFVENLSNWYVRRGRRRYWKSEEDTDKVAAYLTLYEVLTTFLRLLAPFMPFLAEELYQNLVRMVDHAAAESIHLTDWPTVRPELENRALVQATRLVLRVVGVGRTARSVNKLKVRQPLAAALVGLRSPDERALIAPFVADIIDELNVKDVQFLDGATAGGVATETLRPNLPVLGAILGPKTPRLVAAIKSGTLGPEVYAAARAGEAATVVLDGQEITLPADALSVQLNGKEGYAVAAQGGYLVAFPTELSPELLDEGLSREIAHRLNTLRKSAGFDVADNVTIEYVAPPHIDRVVRQYEAYIAAETLARQITTYASIQELSVQDNIPGLRYRETFTVEKEEVTFALSKI